MASGHCIDSAILYDLINHACENLEEKIHGISRTETPMECGTDFLSLAWCSTYQFLGENRKDMYITFVDEPKLGRTKIYIG